MEKKNHQPQPAATKPSKKPARDTRSVEFIAHVHEFRNRVFWVALLFIVSSTLAYQVRDVLIHVVLSPLGDQKLIYLTPAGGFSFIFQITMYAGALVTAPFLVYQLYRFVTPALPPRAQSHSARVFGSALLLMIAGVSFGYFVAVPSALHFLTTFAGSYVDASLTADSYLNFILGYVVGLGILFLLPLLLIFWHWIKPLTPGALLKSERFMIVFAMIAAAIITPTPDVVNQLLIAGPILVVYQVGVVTVLIMIRGERRRLARAQRLAAKAQTLTSSQLARPKVLPVLELPSMEDLTPVKRSVQPAAPVRQQSAPHHAAKALVPQTAATRRSVVPTPPVAVPAVPKAVRTAPVRSMPPRVAHRGVQRSSLPSRPLPRIAASRRLTVDGFAVSAI